MSGLCGVVSLDGRPVDRNELEAMADSLRHREGAGRSEHVEERCAVAALQGGIGPDGRVFCAVARSGDGRYVIVADARLDNPGELRTALGADPGRAADRGAKADWSVAELILAAWMRWGAECVNRLRGDFAFVIGDLAAGRVFAARDPMAMRPLYYQHERGILRFASEAGALLALPAIPTSLRVSRMVRWLAADNAPAGHTFFRGVESLPASCVLEGDAGGVESRGGWSPGDWPELRLEREEEYAECLRHLLLEAARARVGCDERVGILLSGGLDSVSTAGALGTLSGVEIEALSYRYEGFPESDEREISDPLARALGFTVHEVSSDAWQPDGLLRADWAIDSPIVGMYRPLHEASYAISRGRDITRLFSAARGDNMVGAYLWDIEGVVRDHGVREGFRELTAYRSAYGTGWRDAFGATIGEALRHRMRGAMTQGAAPLPDTIHDEAGALGAAAPDWMTPEALELAGPSPGPPEPVRSSDRLRRARAERRLMVFDPFTESGTVQNERIAARNGIRLEDLWGDRRIAEFVCRVPQHVLNRVEEHKRVVRRAIRGWVPESVRGAARKILPAAFGEHALRSREAGSLRELTTDMRLSRASLVDEAALGRTVREFLDGGEFPSALWTAVTLEAWMRANDLEV